MSDPGSPNTPTQPLPKFAAEDLAVLIQGCVYSPKLPLESRRFGEFIADAVICAGWRPPAEGPAATADELEQFAYSYERQAQMFGTPRDDTPAAGIQSTLVDVALELRERAKELKGGDRG